MAPGHHANDRMSDPTTIEKLLLGATSRLHEVSDAARLEAELLLARAIDVPRSYLFAHPEDTPDQAALRRLEETLQRRLDGEPMAYITGVKEFYSLELIVSPATLVPRPETELLVDVALRHIPRRVEWPILDLGTGSGAIALAIARNRPLCRVAAVDISADAVAIARENARQLTICNVEFFEGNWTEPVADRKFHVIASNPPYVAHGDAALDALRAEPINALRSGEDGLDAIRMLGRDCRGVIEDGGLLVLEHGADQKQAVAEVLSSYGWEHIQCYDDYSGHPRVTSARYPSSEMT